MESVNNHFKIENDKGEEMIANWALIGHDVPGIKFIQLHNECPVERIYHIFHGNGDFKCSNGKFMDF